MSINPVELLKQKVTPVFLNDQDGLTSPKNALLSRFYPIFLSILMAKPELIQKLKDSISPSLAVLFGQDEQFKDTFLSKLTDGQLSNIEAE